MLARRPRLALAALLAVYSLLAGAYAAAIPLWEAPDAIWHYYFAAHLAEGGGLPTRADEGISAPWRQQGSQPPLYYLAAAPIIAAVRPTDAADVIRYNPHANVGVRGEGDNLNRMVHAAGEGWPWRGTVLAARLVGLSGLLWGWLAIVGTWSLARVTLPERPLVAVAAAAWLAFNPQFVFLSGAISNDIPITAAAAIALWAMAAVLRLGPTPPRLVALGASLGLATLAKLSGLWLLPLAAGAVGWALYRHPPPAARRGGRSRRHRGVDTDAARPLARIVSAALLVGLPTCLLGGWWYLRNLLLFRDPTGLPLMLSVMTPRPAPPGLRELAAEAVAVWKSFWAVFGWFNVVAPDWVFVATSALTLVGLVGLVAALAGRKVARDAWPGLVLAAAWLALMVVALYLWAQVRYPQGRLLFPAAPALALLVGVGWVLPWSERGGRRVTAALGLTLALLAAWLLPAAILPAYGPPDPPAGGARRGLVKNDRTPAAGEVGHGYVVDPGISWASEDPATFPHAVLNVAPGTVLVTGQTVSVMLPWHVRAAPDRDWSVFLHLVDEEGVVVAQRDSYPGGGARPTGDWRPGDVVPDTHRLTLPLAAGTPPCEACRLVLGWYDAATGARFPAGALAQGIELVRFHVEPARDAAGRPLLREPVLFGEDILLAGYDLHRRDLAPGEKLRVALYWRALRRPRADYRVSVQLRDGDGIVAQSDAAPADDTRPTSTWLAGEQVADPHVLRVPAATVPGVYALRLVMYAPSGRALPVQFRDFERRLGPIQVSQEDG